MGEEMRWSNAVARRDAMEQVQKPDDTRSRGSCGWPCNVLLRSSGCGQCLAKTIQSECIVLSRLWDSRSRLVLASCKRERFRLMMSTVQ